MRLIIFDDRRPGALRDGQVYDVSQVIGFLFHEIQ